MGYAKGYKHPHQQSEAITDMTCLPDSLAEAEFYLPTDRGYEKILTERLLYLQNRRKKNVSSAD